MRIRRIINQNSTKIIIGIIVIVFVIAITQLLNYIAKESSKNKKNMENLEQNTKTSTDQSLYPAISQDKNDDMQETGNYKEFIEKFMKLCNEGNPEQAYSLISNDCKEVFYKDYTLFFNNYYKKNFSSKKSYSIQNWIDNIFKVDIKEDILSTGGTASNNIQDYISVIKENNEYKLNINSYIRREKINAETKQEDITFRVIKKDSYMKYEKYYLEIKNNGNKDILLDDLTNSTTLYLLDENDVKYPVTNDELTKEQLYIRSGVTMKMSIKFTNAYTQGRELKNIVFSKATVINDDGTSDEREYKVNL